MKAPVRRVVFFGVAHWCTFLMDACREVDTADRQFVRWSRRRPFDALRSDAIAVRVGFRPGARTWRGTVFDLVWSATTRPGRRCTYWIGTDVARALVPGGTRRRGVVRWLAGRSAGGAPWFVDELRDVGIEAADIRFPYRTTVVETPHEWPERFTVSSYVPEVNAEQYGVDTLRHLVDALPDVSFLFFGGGHVVDRPNTEHLGWIADVDGLLDRSVVHARLTRHDAIAGTVRDALARGRHVVFGYALPGVHQCDHGDATRAIAVLDQLRRDFDAGSLPFNDEGRAFALELDAHGDALRFLTWLVTGEPAAGRDAASGSAAPL